MEVSMKFNRYLPGIVLSLALLIAASQIDAQTRQELSENERDLS